MEGRGGDPTGYQEWQGTAMADGELSMAGAHPWALHKGLAQGPWPRVWAGLAPSSAHMFFFFLGWENLTLTSILGNMVEHPPLRSLG